MEGHSPAIHIYNYPECKSAQNHLSCPVLPHVLRMPPILSSAADEGDVARSRAAQSHTAHFPQLKDLRVSLFIQVSEHTLARRLPAQRGARLPANLLGKALPVLTEFKLLDDVLFLTTELKDLDALAACPRLRKVNLTLDNLPALPPSSRTSRLTS
jgi:hypothetical protein